MLRKGNYNKLCGIIWNAHYGVIVADVAAKATAGRLHV